MVGKIQNLSEISDLILLLTETQNFFQKQVQKQVNTALTLRNWLFGFYINEYEMNGLDRAEYGKGVMKEIAQRSVHIKGLSERNLYLFRTFYLSYPMILQSLTAKSFLTDFRQIPIFHAVTGKLQLSYNIKQNQMVEDICGKLETNPEILINRLSFTHIIELLKADTLLKRFFYETETIKNNWSVRELQRAMNSLLYERTGMSKNENLVKYATAGLPQQVFVSKYLVNLPSESELKKIIQQEQDKISNREK
ncbi:hypothetical protein KA996_07885 [bacterium]|nr:hypothetical protein [bacterium]